jgi:uncharacterized membrane protein YgdD (TMEM256/DUF423 family)
MERIFFFLGALSAGLGVAAGAFGAHALKTRLSAEMLTIFETGVRYQMYHALALFVVSWVLTRWPSTAVNLGGWCFVIGTLLFSGSLYVLTLSGVKWWGVITPLGGVAFLIGWGCLAWAVWRS